MRNRTRKLQVETLEVRRVLSCDFTMDGICDADDLDVIYDAKGTSAGRASLEVIHFNDIDDFFVEAVTRPIHPAAVAADPALTDGRVFDLYVTSERDLLLIDAEIELSGNLSNHPLGSDANAPPEALLDALPGLRADSWVTTTPGNGISQGSLEDIGSTFTAFDTSVGENLSRFHFARIVVTPDENGFLRGSFNATAQLASEITPTYHEFFVDLVAVPIRNQFSYDEFSIIDYRDIPGWLASASARNPDSLTYRMGDVNLDGAVDSDDLGLLLNNFANTEDVGWGSGDLDMSGVIDSDDLGLLLNSFGYSSAATSASINRAADAINAFAGDLYERLQHEEGNVVFSPLSIATALSMTYAGANGETAREMEEVLRLGSEPGIHSAFRDLLDGFAQSPVPTEIEVANAIWPNSKYPVSDDFVSTVSSNYGATAQNLDYSDPDAAEEVINSWVEEATRGRIKELVDSLDANTVMVLTNSVFFKSFWEIPFDPTVTAPGPFETGEGDIVNPNMMYLGPDHVSSDNQIRFATVDGFDVLELPFRGRTASMVFMLPSTAAPTNLTSETLASINDWVEDGTQSENGGCVEIRMPRFETSVSTNLSSLLPAMGMPTAFSGDADFSGIFQNGSAFIDDVNHEAFLQVTELGAEAAASTSVELIICFAAGTPVLTPDGPKPIESIKVGDYVLARDENDPEGCVRPKLVEELFHGQKPVLRLQVDGQVLQPTDTHPFYVKDNGWVAAGDLKVGDLLSTNQGTWVAVEDVTVLANDISVHNFRIADFHTYFVGDEECAVWAHNCCGVTEFNVDRAFHFLIRDNVNDTTLFMGRIDDPTQSTNDLNPSIPAATSESIALPLMDTAKYGVPAPFAMNDSMDAIDVLDAQTDEFDVVCESPHESLETLMAALAKFHRPSQESRGFMTDQAMEEEFDRDGESKLDQLAIANSLRDLNTGRQLSLLPSRG